MGALAVSGSGLGRRGAGSRLTVAIYVAAALFPYYVRRPFCQRAPEVIKSAGLTHRLDAKAHEVRLGQSRHQPPGSRPWGPFSPSWTSPRQPDPGPTQDRGGHGRSMDPPARQQLANSFHRASHGWIRPLALAAQLRSRGVRVASTEPAWSGGKPQNLLCCEQCLHLGTIRGQPHTATSWLSSKISNTW